MAKQVDKMKFGWVLKEFSSLQSEKCYSVPVFTSGCKWRLVAFPKGNNSDHLSLYLAVADSESLPYGWERYVKLRLTIVNQVSEKLSITKETERYFDGKSTTSWGFRSMLSLSKLHEKDGGFLVNGDLIIVAEVDVLEFIGTFDGSEKSEEASEILSQNKKIVGDNMVKKTSLVKESNNVNGPMQVENPAKSSLKIKFNCTKFLIFIFSLIGFTSLMGFISFILEELLNARKRTSA